MRSSPRPGALRFTVVLCATMTLCVPVERSAAQTARPFEAFSVSARSLRDSLVQLARAQIGRRYRMGGESPQGGFDCSGLVAYVMATLHLQVPRTARLQAREGLAVGRDTSRLLPGDVLTFGRTRQGVSHVGIYVGDGRFVHASSVAGRVIESAIDRPPSRLIKPWRGARRLVTFDDALPAIAIIGLTPDSTVRRSDWPHLPD